MPTFAQCTPETFTPPPGKRDIARAAVNFRSRPHVTLGLVENPQPQTPNRLNPYQSESSSPWVSFARLEVTTRLAAEELWQVSIVRFAAHFGRKRTGNLDLEREVRSISAGRDLRDGWGAPGIRAQPRSASTSWSSSCLVKRAGSQRTVGGMLLKHSKSVKNLLAGLPNSCCETWCAGRVDLSRKRCTCLPTPSVTTLAVLLIALGSAGAECEAGSAAGTHSSFFNSRLPSESHPQPPGRAPKEHSGQVQSSS